MLKRPTATRESVRSAKVKLPGGGQLNSILLASSVLPDNGPFTSMKLPTEGMAGVRWSK